MPSVARELTLEHPPYTVDELKVIRRNILLYARSFPPGLERNKHRQVALSRLFKNEKWLGDHTLEGADLTYRKGPRRRLGLISLPGRLSQTTPDRRGNQ
jgi:hypothetical protein